MFSAIVDFIQSKTRGEWERSVIEQVTSFRIWLQENGELAFVAGAFGCFLIVVFIKLVSVLAALGIIIAFVFYSIARPDADTEGAEAASSQISASEEGSEDGVDGVRATSAALKNQNGAVPDPGDQLGSGESS